MRVVAVSAIVVRTSKPSLASELHWGRHRNRWADGHAVNFLFDDGRLVT